MGLYGAPESAALIPDAVELFCRKIDNPQVRAHVAAKRAQLCENERFGLDTLREVLMLCTVSECATVGL